MRLFHLLRFLVPHPAKNQEMKASLVRRMRIVLRGGLRVKQVFAQTLACSIRYS